MSFLSYLPAAIRILEGTFSLVKTEFPDLAGMAVAKAGINLAAAGSDVVAAKASPSTLAELGSAAMAAAQAAGLSSEDQANVAKALPALSLLAQMGGGLVEVGMPQHAPVVQAGVDVLSAFAGGVASVLPAASPAS